MGTQARHQFRGFDDWFEVFSAGVHTDSAGKQKPWTTEELDEMVRNHTSAPLVIGHPKTDDPAWGWSHALMREGNILLARATDVQPQFAAMVEKKQFPERSLSVMKTDKGWKVRHIGFLGAVPPAVDGLKRMQFNAADAAEIHEFSFNDGYQLSLIAGLFRGVRDFLIGQFGQDKADQVLPSYSIDSLQREAIAEQMEDEPSLSPAPSFSGATQQDTTVPNPAKQITQADIDAALAAQRQQLEEANAKLAQFARAQRLTEAKTLVSELVSSPDGNVRLLPAQTEGLAEFMADLDDPTVTEFTFAAADGTTQKAKRAEFMASFLKGLKPVMKLGQQQAAADTDPGAVTRADFAAPAGAVVDASRNDQYQRAKAYQAENPNCSWADAVRAVGG